jgi:hypothetical protein
MFKRNMVSLFAALALPACVGGSDTSTSIAIADIEHDACPAGVPSSLAPAADQDLAFTLDATGVQEYTCNGTAWVFVAPDAQLYLPNNANTAVGHHFAGPTWEWYEDGSSVVGRKVAAGTVDKSAIPWLLLVAANHGGDDGRMTPVTSIQRLQTVGGNAPATGCDAAHAGAAANVPYTATYFFYVTRDPNKPNNQRCGA